METPPDDVTGIVLVGGKSRRMGVDKALLRVGGEPLVTVTARALREAVPRLLLVGGPAERFDSLGLPVFEDIYPGSSLGGLYTGLVVAGTPHVLAVACDMPYPNPVLMRHLVGLRHGADVVVPRRGKFLEPLCAVYSARCREPMQAMLEEGRLRIDDLFDRVCTRYLEGAELEALDAGGRSFINVNTPEEYRRVAGEDVP